MMWYFLHVITSSPTPSRSSLPAWVDSLQSAGRYTFTRSEAALATSVSDKALAASLRRLHKAGRIARPRRGFHVVVPLEYRALGCPPAPWFIDDLMTYLGRCYYVGLLTAAAHHGASHQAAQVFQVVVDLPTRPVASGRVRIDFHEGFAPPSQTLRVNTPTGAMLVSTPERTALDLVRYPLACGGFGHVAVLLRELSETLDPARLVEAAPGVERSVVQRTGWLLDLVGCRETADPLARWLAGQVAFPVALRSDFASGRRPRDERWKVVVNDEIELDE